MRDRQTDRQTDRLIGRVRNRIAFNRNIQNIYRLTNFFIESISPLINIPLWYRI